ncbi:MAG TPA: ElyC/SanA/YdcF family protein [Gammaproteobacteria bacterium]|nr:ElyC/SanA/YdcF family protein [Gammaproteobacteria bacterium]
MTTMFVLKQLVNVLIAPLTVALVLVVAGGAMLLRGRRRVATRLLCCGALLAYLASMPFVGDVLLIPLERQYPAVADDGPVPPAAFVVVLGSSYRPRSGLPVTAALDREGLARIVEGMRLIRKLPSAKLIVSGGAPVGSVPTAHGYAELARQLGIDEAALVVFDTPLDTTAEARGVAAYVGQEAFLLVTSAYHMPRAMRRMEMFGVRPIPAPTAHLTPLSLDASWRDFLPMSAGVNKSERAAHEYVGLLGLALGFE